MGQAEEVHIMVKKVEYEVSNSYANATFHDIDEAISALWLMGSFFNIHDNIRREEVKRSLEKYGFYKVAIPRSHYELTVTKYSYS